MVRAVIDNLLRVAAFPTGPIFAKELRVSSRQRRNYVLRFAYVILLSGFTALVWASKVESVSGGGVGQTISRMSEAAKPTVATVAWFQFCGLQLVAVVMLSTAVSGEIRARTLGVLMTTPISAFQIVFGKLFSKLLQLSLLLALSVPVLAVVRSFGGVPWRFVACSVAVTFTACLLAGSVSMAFSVVFRRAYAAILLTLAVGAFLYAVLPGIVMMLLALSFRGGGPGLVPREALEWFMTCLVHANPFAMETVATAGLFEPGFARNLPFFLWPVHCAFMLALSACALLLCVRLVRRAALRQAMGGPVAQEASPPTAPAMVLLPAGATPPVPNATAPPAPPAQVAGRAGRIREVRGSPVLWKELRTPLTRSLPAKIVAVTLPLTIAGVMYLLVGLNEALDEPEVQALFVSAYMVIGLVVTAVVAATPIATEKESQSWPLLLATPLTERGIVWGKFAGVIARIWPAWVLPAGHVLVFMIGILSPAVAVLMAMEAAALVVFLTGSGMLFGALFRRTTTAVVMNLGTMIVLWALVPLLLGFASSVWDSDDPLEAAVDANPVALAWEVTDAYCLSGHDYPWSPPREARTWPAHVDHVTFLSGGYGLAGLVLVAGAMRLVRRRVF